MDKFDSKVVSFARNAGYLRERALKNRREGKNIDALELMRQASLREPDNADYAMELADMYAEMGLNEQANRAMLRVMTRDGVRNECLYQMANHLYHRGEISRAERVLRAYLEGGAEGERAAQAERFLDEIAFAREYALPRDRKSLRAARLAGMAYQVMRGGNSVLGERLLNRSIRLRNANAETRALHALCLFLNGRRDEAREELENTEKLMIAPSKPHSGVKAQCLAAQVWNYLGERTRAETLIEGALNEEADDAEALLRVIALCEMGMHERAYEASQQALKRMPYSKELLHISSAAAFNCDLSAEEVQRGWRRIARLDPDDLVCDYFMESAENGTLTRPMHYMYLLPAEEMTKKFAYISHRVHAGPQALREAWRGDHVFRSILLWELAQENEQLARTALTVLSGIDDDEAQTIVRIYAERPDVDMSVRMYALSMMRMQGIEPDSQLRDSFLSAGMPSEDEIMREMSLGEKQMIRYAAEYVEDVSGDYPVADIALIWHAFSATRGSASDPVSRSEAGSAALAMVYMQLHGGTDDIYSVSRWYGCSPRQAAHIARRLRDVIGMSNTEE